VPYQRTAVFLPAALSLTAERGRFGSIILFQISRKTDRIKRMKEEDLDIFLMGF
jgi:hypothetical protein